MKKKRKYKCDCHLHDKQVCDICQEVSKNDKDVFVPSTLQDRIDFLKQTIREATRDHGVPCMCLCCEALQFDWMAAEGKINLKTGQRK